MSETTTEKPAEATAEKAVPAMKAIPAKKIGMTCVFSPKGEIVPVTVFRRAVPCGSGENPATDGYAALQLGFGDIRPKNFSKPEAGHFAKTNAVPTRWLQEFRLPSVDGFEAGMEIRVEQFAAGDIIDASGMIKERASPARSSATGSKAVPKPTASPIAGARQGLQGVNACGPASAGPGTWARKSKPSSACSWWT